jgi:ferrous iron transport protein A
MRDATSSSPPLLRRQISFHQYSHPTHGDEVDAYVTQRPSLVPLADMSTECTVYLAANGTNGLLRQRLVDLGFIPGTPLRLIRRGPRGNLVAVRVRSTVIALRSDEAHLLLVSPNPSSSEACRE